MIKRYLQFLNHEIMIKTKVLPILAILFRPFGFLAPKGFKIIWLSNILDLSVPDEGYCRNASCALHLIAMLYHMQKRTIYLTFNV